MEQWGIVIAFGGTMAALLTSFHALPKTERDKYRRLFQAWVVVTGIGTLMQLYAIIFP